MKQFSKRLFSLLLVMAMLLSLLPMGALAVPASDLPKNMIDSPILRALEYTGYDVQKQKDNGTLYQNGYYAQDTPKDILSDIHYGTGLSGMETVIDNTTFTGKAPDKWISSSIQKVEHEYFETIHSWDEYVNICNKTAERKETISGILSCLYLMQYIKQNKEIDQSSDSVLNFFDEINIASSFMKAWGICNDEALCKFMLLYCALLLCFEEDNPIPTGSQLSSVIQSDWRPLLKDLDIVTDTCFAQARGSLNMSEHIPYANNHTGFCLVFRATNGMLQQSSTWQKEYVPFAANNIDMPLAFRVPQSFKFRDVEYVDTPSYLDCSSFFSTSEAIYTDDGEELKQLYEKYIQTYLQKHRVWDYEEETRIILAAGSPLATGRKVSIPPHHRLFHYESTQLAGIVLGANMPVNQRRRVRDIVSEKVNRWNTDIFKDKIPPSFVIFEECFSESNREVKPVPVEIYKGTSILDAKHSQFQALLNEWHTA